MVHLPADPHVVAEARRHAVETCGESLDPQRRDDLALAVSELVTNAIRHGDEPVSITVEAHDGVVRVEVTDANPRLVLPPEQDLLAPGRRGLRLVEAVCRTWGWHPVDGGKCVWCEV